MRLWILNGNVCAWGLSKWMLELYSAACAASVLQRTSSLSWNKCCYPPLLDSSCFKPPNDSIYSLRLSELIFGQRSLKDSFSPFYWNTKEKHKSVTHSHEKQPVKRQKILCVPEPEPVMDRAMMKGLGMSHLSMNVLTQIGAVCQYVQLRNFKVETPNSV